MPPDRHRNHAARVRLAISHPRCPNADATTWATWYVRGLDGEPWTQETCGKTQTTRRSEAARTGWCWGARERLKRCLFGTPTWLEQAAC